MNTMTDIHPEVKPFADAVDEYWAKGWESIIPIKARDKAPIIQGFSGKKASIPDYDTVKTWKIVFPGANIGLVLPDGIIGIDVDHYGEKRGADTLKRLERELGPLPPTWISTSKESPSGIRLFSVPPGTRLRGKLGPGIDVIQSHHRHINVWPSIHPNGKQYHWINPDGEVVEEVPRLDDFLPSS